MSTAEIRRIHKEYFDVLDHHFTAERKEFEKARISDWEMIGKYVSDTFAPQFNSGLVVHDPTLGSVPSILYKVYQLLTSVSAFWVDVGDTLYLATKLSDALCCKVTDPESLETNRHIKSLGLYFDTVCFSDPLYHLARSLSPQQAERLHGFGLNALFQYFLLISRKRLFVNDSEYPIAILYPEVSNDDVWREIGKNAYEKMRLFASELCNKEFSDYGEVIAHFESSSLQEIWSRMKVGPLPMFCADLEEKVRRIPNLEGTLEERLNFAVHSSRSLSGTPELPECRGAQSLLTACFRTFQLLEVENYECAKLGADPFLHPQTWEPFKWGLRKNAVDFGRFAGIREELAILRAFDLPDLQWLANVEINELVALRERGQMEEMRKMFRINRKRLKTATVDDFEQISSEVAQNIELALAEHSQRMEKERKLSEKARRRGLISFSIGAGLSIASIALPSLLPLAFLSLSYSAIVGSKSIMNVVNEHLSGKKRVQELSERPIGILLRAKTSRES